MSPFKEEIKVMLAVLRAQHNRMTQSELARLSGLSQSAISELETGKSTGIDFLTLAKLCSVLNCQPGDLLGYTPDGPQDEAMSAAAKRRANNEKATNRPDNAPILDAARRRAGK